MNGITIMGSVDSIEKWAPVLYEARSSQTNEVIEEYRGSRRQRITVRYLVEGSGFVTTKFEAPDGDVNCGDTVRIDIYKDES